MRSSLLGRSTDYLGLVRDSLAIRTASNAGAADMARRHLAARMGRLRGLPQKIGQMLSMAEGDDAVEPFEALREGAEPLPWTQVEALLAEAWGQDPESVLHSVDERGLAASLGQVHRATLHDGREVAVKVRYPGIRAAVMNDLKMLGWLSLPVGNLRRGFDLGAYQAEVLRDLNDELDYDHERLMQRRCGELLGASGRWIVPGVVDEWCRPDVLVTNWEQGATIDEAATWPQEARTDLARLLVRGFVDAAFRHGVLHADPHPGNYRFRRLQDGCAVVLYDFGSVAKIPPERRLLLLKLIEMTASGSGDPLGVMLALGFRDDMLRPLRAKLPALLRVVLEPFVDPGIHTLDPAHRRERVEDILGDDRWNFRMSGPPHLVFLLRAIGGLAWYLRRLEVNVSWSRPLAPILRQQAGALVSLQTVAPQDTAGPVPGMARHLRIHVAREGRTTVALTFPAMSIDEIETLMGDDLAARIASEGIDTRDLVRRVRRSGYAPQAVFILPPDDGRREVRVWLE